MLAPFPQILNKLLLWNALGNMQTSQEYFTTTVDAKFWGKQSELCEIGDREENKLDIFCRSSMTLTPIFGWLIGWSVILTWLLLEIWLN